MQAAIGYVRVSTEEQGVSGLGLADQRARIEAYCTLRGLRLAATIDDVGVSGGKVLASRPGGGRLLRCLQERKAGHVVMLKVDRGFRNAADCLATVEAWQRRQVTLHVIDLGGNAIDTASAAGKFMLTVLAGAAEMERNLTEARRRIAVAFHRIALDCGPLYEFARTLTRPKAVFRRTPSVPTASVHVPCVPTPFPVRP